MSLSFVPFCIFIILGALSVVEPKSDIINIGYIVPLQTINGRVSSIALKAAVDDVNSDPTILLGRQLKISVHDTNFTGFYGILGGKKILTTVTMHVLVNLIIVGLEKCKYFVLKT